MSVAPICIETVRLMHRYSYTAYDALGRTVEAGELTPGLAADAPANTPLPSPMFDYADAFYSRPVLTPANIAAVFANGTCRQVTRSRYDLPQDNTTNALFAGGQGYLRSRVATVTYHEQGSDPYRFASHYSYDIHGNVERLVQENRDLEHLQASVGGGRQSVKRLRYVYDLISGKVDSALYQQGEADGMSHAYTYDGDNRLTHVLTSTAGGPFVEDASYLYYKHGPLARMELGSEGDNPGPII